MVFRFDLDKTYLATDLGSLYALLRVPFERAEDKRTIPGVVELLRSLRRSAERRGEAVQLHFLSASPPQIGGAIRRKLAMDGVVYDDIRFKNQMRHLVRGELSQLREQIGYKLSELLRSARSIPEGAREMLFGDDWESDAYIYSLYADLVAGRVEPARACLLLERAGADDYYIRQIEGLLAMPRPRFSVAGIFILRARKRRPAELGAFGPRLVWFDNYFECALRMSVAGLADDEAPARVAAAIGMDSSAVRRSFEAVAVRGAARGPAAFGGPARVLERAGLAADLPRGPLLARARRAVTGWLGRVPLPIAAGRSVPDYEVLVDHWTHRGARTAMADDLTGDIAAPQPTEEENRDAT